MKKTTIALTLLMWCAALAFAQARDQRVLAILPFTGGAGEDGEAIAVLLSMEPAITNAFTVVGRGRTLEVVFAEHHFQMDEEFTDVDTIAGIGHILNANYVLSGSIRQLGDRNLVIVTLLHIERLEQVAGYWLTYYADIEEVRDFLPDMARSMADIAQRDTSRLPNLAVLPLDIVGVSSHDAETLAQVLAIEMIRTGSYAIFPRTSAIESAVAEIDFQGQDYTPVQGMAEVGRAANAQYALSIRAHRLGDQNFFTATMLSVRYGTQRAAAHMDFFVVEDGIDGMRELALTLDSAGAHAIRGDDHFGMGEYTQAIAAFQEALRLSPNHPRAIQRLAVVREAAVNIHITRGDAHYRNRLFNLSIVEFDTALRIVPNHARARAGRDRAIRGQTEARVWVQIDRGDRLMETGDYDEAIYAFESAVQIMPEHSVATQRLEVARKRWGIVGETENMANAHVTRGNNYLNRRRFNRAIAEFEAALRLMPDHPTASRHLQDAQNAAREWEAMARTRFHSIGFSIGTSLAYADGLSLIEPQIIGTVRGTWSPRPFWFISFGSDFGFGLGSVMENTDYSLMNPFIHFAGFLPLPLFGPCMGWGGLYIGAGGGFRMERYSFGDDIDPVSRGWPPDFATGIITADFTAGVIFWRNRIHLSYTKRTNMLDMRNTKYRQHKVSIGGILRFPHILHNQRSR